MASLDDLKKRIASVKSTQKITKAMKMVAAAKLRRAQESAERGRPYSEKMNNIILNLSNGISDKENAPKLLSGTGENKVHLCVVMTSDRGLCGGFNSNIIKKAKSYFSKILNEGKQLKIITVGSKGNDQLKRVYGDKIIENMIKDNEIIDFCLVGEPTSSKKIADCARIGRRGSLGGHLKIYGRQGHIAYPEKIINPISKSGDLISKLSSKVWDKGNEAFDPTSFQISNIKSGTGAHNVVPGELELTFNFRFSPESNEKTLKLKFESLLNDLDINYDIVWDLNGTPYYTKNGLFRSIVSDSIKEITGYLPEFNTKGGTSDGRFIAKMNAEIIELGPVNKSIHQINEHIKISELLTLKEIYSNILSKVNQAF